MINVLIIDKDKNTIEIDLCDYEYRHIFSESINTSKIKRHKTMKELDSEVSIFIKKEGENNE